MIATSAAKVWITTHYHLRTCEKSREEKPHFQYWDLTLKPELLLLILVRAHTVGNFELFIDVLVERMTWFFALDQTNYDKCLPVHIGDLISLTVRHPPLAAEFHAGNFVIYKTTNSMSTIAIDQAHEHNNGQVKGSGGAVGLTENPSVLRRWMVAGPEFARMLQEFEDILHKQNERVVIFIVSKWHSFKKHFLNRSSQ